MSSTSALTQGPNLPSDAAKRVRFIVNAASNLAYFVFSAGLMVWYVPYLVHHLGPAAYGILPLANAVVMQAVMLSDGLNTSAFRFLAIDMGRGDAAAAQRTFNSAAVLISGTCLLLLVLSALCVWLLPAVFHLSTPVGEARFLFASMFLTTIAAIFSGLFGTPTQILHRFDLRNLARTATLAARVGVVVICFAVWPANLWIVGAGLLTSAAVGLACEMLICWRLAPQLAFRPHHAQPDRVRDLVGLTKWSTINMFGALLMTQLELVIVNLTFGAEMTGRYGSLILLPTLVTAIAEIVVPILSPEIMARYAAGDRLGIERLASSAVRLVGVGLALPAGIICGFGHPFLSLWLGPAFADLDLVLALMSGHLAISLSTRVLFYVLTAYNAVRVQAFISVGAGLVYLGVALALARWSGWGVASIAAATALVWCLKNSLVIPAYCARVVGLSPFAFIRPLAAPLIGLAAVTLAGRLLCDLYALTSWVSLAAAVTLVTLAYGVGAYALLLTGADRRVLRGAVGRDRSA